MPILNFLAQYSNLVCAAVMPHFSDYAAALDLPDCHPIARAAIRRFAVDPEEPVRCSLELTNGMVFFYEDGHVDVFEDRPHTRHDSFGVSNMTPVEAVTLARNCISKLGYSTNQTLLDQDPEVVFPPVYGITNTIPYYTIKWPSLSPWGTLEAEVDAERKVITRLTMLSEVFERPSPKIPNAPPCPDRPNLANSNYMLALLPDMVSRVSEFANKLHLPISSVDTNAVEACECTPGVGFTIRLTNGFYFNIGPAATVNSFVSPKSYFMRGLGETGLYPRRTSATVEDFAGTQQMSKTEMFELVRNTIQELGMKPEDFSANGEPTQIVTADKLGKYEIPRVFLAWNVEAPDHSGMTVSSVGAEIDTEKKCLCSFYYRGPDWQKRGWPDVGVKP